MSHPREVGDCFFGDLNDAVYNNKLQKSVQILVNDLGPGTTLNTKPLTTFFLGMFLFFKLSGISERNNEVAGFVRRIMPGYMDYISVVELRPGIYRVNVFQFNDGQSEFFRNYDIVNLTKRLSTLLNRPDLYHAILDGFKQPFIINFIQPARPAKMANAMSSSIPPSELTPYYNI